MIQQFVEVLKVIGRPASITFVIGVLVVGGGITGREPGSAPEGEAMRKTAESLGVRPPDILVENESKTTREESIVIARLLAGRMQQPIVLVTSGTHMARALAVFRAAGFD